MNGWELRITLKCSTPKRLWLGWTSPSKTIRRAATTSGWALLRYSSVTAALAFASLYVMLQGRQVTLEKLQITISLQLSCLSQSLLRMFRWYSLQWQVLVWPQNENIWKFLWMCQPLDRNLPKYEEAFLLSFPLSIFPLSFFQQILARCKTY